MSTDNEAFLIEVGTNFSHSGQRLKKDIQEVLDTLSAYYRHFVITAHLDADSTLKSFQKTLDTKVMKNLQVDFSKVKLIGLDENKVTTSLQKSINKATKNVTIDYGSFKTTGSTAAKSSSKPTTSASYNRSQDPVFASNLANITKNAKAAAMASNTLSGQLQMVATSGKNINPAPMTNYANIAGHVTIGMTNATAAAETFKKAADSIDPANMRDSADILKKISDLMAQRTNTQKDLIGLDESSDRAKLLHKTLKDLDEQIGELQQRYQGNNPYANMNSVMEAFVMTSTKVKNATDRLAKSQMSLDEKTTFAKATYEEYQKVLNNSKASGAADLLEKLNAIHAEFETTHDIEVFKKSINGLNQEMKDGGFYGGEFLNKLVQFAGKKITGFLWTQAFMKLRTAIGDVIPTVIQLDSALTQLKIVTGDTDQVYQRFMKNAARAAQQTGQSIMDIVKSTETYARLGYNLEESLNLSKVTAQYANVAAVEQSAATSSITAILKGFNKDASEAEHVADILTLVGQKYAITAGELGTALENGGAAMYAANNTLEESVALLAAGNAAVQDASATGNAFKTVTLRLRGAKADLEAAGEEVDEFCESTAKMQKQIKALSGVDIMKNATEFKSTYQIFTEIARQWEQMTDINKASLLEALGGKRQASIVASAINNIKDMQGAFQAATDAAGTLADANEKYLDSVQGKLGQLKASWQEFANGVLDNDILKVGIDLLKGILDVLNRLDDVTGGASTNVLMMATAFMALSGSALSASKAFEEFTKGTTMHGAATALTGNIQTLITSLISVKSLLILVAAAAAVAFGAFIKNKYFPSLETLQSNLSKVNDELDSVQSKLQETNFRRQELQDAADNGTITLIEQAELDRLKEVNSELEKTEGQLQKDKRNLTNSINEKYAERGKQFLDSDQVTYYEYGSSQYSTRASRREFVDNAWAKYQENPSDVSIVSMKAELQKQLNEFTAMQNNFKPGDGLFEEYEDYINKLRTIRGSVEDLQSVYNSITASSPNAVKALKEFANSENVSADGLDAFINGLDDVKQADIADYFEKLKEYNIFDVFSDDGTYDPAKVEHLINQLRTIGEVESDIADSAFVDAKSIGTMVDELSGPINALHSAMQEMNNTGHISAETMKTISSQYPSLMKYIKQTENGYILEDGALQGLLASQRQEYQHAFNEAKDAADKLIGDEARKKVAYDGTTLSIIRQLQAQRALAELDYANAYSNAYNTSLANGKNESESSLEAWRLSESGRKNAKLKIANIDSAIQSIINADKNLKQLDPLTKTILNGLTGGGSSGSSSGSSKSAAEKAEDELEKEQKLFEEWYDLKKREAEKQRELNPFTIGVTGDTLSSIPNDAISTYESMLNTIMQALKKAHDRGLDETSDYVQKLQNMYKETADSIVKASQEAFDKYISHMDNFNLWDNSDISKVDVLNAKLADLNKRYQDGLMLFKDYYDQYESIAKNIYDTQKDSMETIIELTMDMIRKEAEDQVDALDDQVDSYKKIIDQKKKLLDMSKDEADYEDEVAERVAEIAKLETKIAQLRLDDSREAQAQRIKLEEELAEKQKDLNKYQNDYAVDNTKDALDQMLENFEDEKDAEKEAIEKSVDTWVKVYDKAIKRIDTDWDGLYDDLYEYQSKYRTSIDGMDSLVTAWGNATAAVQKYGDIVSALNGIETENQLTKADAILGQMRDNSISAKQHGTSTVNGVNLHAENKRLAAEYEAETGRALVYTDAGWAFADTGALAYTLPSGLSSSTTSGSSTTTQTNTSSGGHFYNATIQKMGRSPNTSSTLKNGSSGADVKWLQAYLQETGWYTGSIDGQFGAQTAAAVKGFQDRHKLPVDGIVGKNTWAEMAKYHSGGIVDGRGAINDTEVLAILKRGELVLNDVQKANLRNLLEGMKSTISVMADTRLRSNIAQAKYAAVGNSGSTFSPTVNVTINHNGSMTDADVKRYGEKIGNTALDTLYNTMRSRGIMK